jgi:hypothetical protein
MQTLIWLVWTAGAVQLALIIGNVFLARKLNVRDDLLRVPGILRQIFVVHWLYIVFVLFCFTGLCFFFAPELAGASGLGRFLSAALAAFWLLRIPLQFFYYDPGLRRRHRVGDAAYLAAISYLAAVFSLATLRILR